MIALNQQPVEKQVLADTLDLVGEPWLTIQGEGPYAGMPAVFLRTAGCDLQCPLCDTDYTSNRRSWAAEEIVETIQRLTEGRPSLHLVVITGGEPFRQNLTPSVLLLLARGYLVQIETNGTLYLDGFPYLETTIVCSPKTGSIHPKLQAWVRHLKYIVEAELTDPSDGLPLDSLGSGVRVARPWPGYSGKIYVQPLDVQDPERNKAHIVEAVWSCLRFGYTLSLQLHKIVGLP